MSYKRCRSLADVSRHGLNVEATCRCGHRAVLNGRQLVHRFIMKNWPKGIELVGERLRCVKCGRRGARVEPTLADVSGTGMVVRSGR